MASPAEDIAGLLIAQGIGTAGVDLFVSADPGGLTQTVTLYDVSGRAPDPKYARDYVDVQISIWGAVNDYTGGYAKATIIKNYLLGLAAQTIGTKIYFAFNMRSNIAAVGYDANNRPQFVMYFRVIIDDADVGNRISI